MAVTPQITFHQIDGSPFVRARIQERAEKLVRFHDRITACRVVVDAPHRHHHKGKLYSIAIEVILPGGTVTSHRSPGDHHSHEDIYVAIRDAFDAVERQIQDFVRRQGAA